MQTPSSLKTLTTWRLTAFCCAFLVIILSGCSGGEPPEELLRNHMEREMLRAAGKDSPPVFSIASLEPNWVQNGETAYEGRVAMTLALGQDLFETANLAEALEKAGEKSSETALYRYAENQAQTLPEPLRGSLLERAPKPLPDSLVFIKSVTASGYTMTVNFMIRADKKAEGWTFTVLTYPEGEGPGGLPRSSFSDKALIVGSEEARKSIRAFIADTKNFAREVEEAKANQKKAQADAIAAQEKARTDAIAAKRKAILDIVKPGAVLWGVGESEDTPAERFGFIVGEGDAIGSTFSVKLLVPDEFPDLPAGKIQLRADPKHPYPLTLVLPSDVTVELDLADGKLTGPVSGANVNGEAKAFFSPITAEQLNREKEQAAARVAEKKAREEKAAAEEKARQEKVAAEEKARLEKVAAEKKARLEKAATEKKQREDAYAAALDKALAPQSGYQGSWTRSDKSGPIGLAVLAVTPNGLGASGYIFDPLAREKRKPFSATINRDLNADNALVIQTTPGQGLARNEADTDFQRDWLARDARNALTLKLTPDGGWLGATQERVVVALRPIAGFAEELQKEAAEIAAKRKAILDAVKPGAAFWGTIESGNKPTERIGFIVGEGDAIGSTFSVKILVPDEFPDLPAGKIQLRADPKHPYPLILVLPPDVTVELDLADGKLTGSASGGAAKVFFSSITAEQLNLEKKQAAARVAEKKAREEKAAAEEKARLEKAAAEEKARREKAAAEKKQREDAYAAALDKALAPQSGYQGSWTRSDKSGSIGLAVLSVTPNGLGASGYIFDPLAREKRKPFSATINRDLNADNALVIQTTPGQGLTRNEADTDFQRDWLARDARNALTLKLTPDGGWLGATQERVVVALRPIAGFAEELQKEAAVQKAYQDALNKGVSPGATWIGTFQCGNDAGEIGMLFEKRVENTLSGYFFNPSTPAKRKAFSGSLHTRGKDAPIAVKAERPGIPHYNGMSDLDRRWLGENLSYDGEARISDGILNLNSSSCNAVFKASPEPYTQLLAKAAAAEKAGQEAFMATIQPGARYEGTWKRNDGSGELAILFTGLRAVTVSAEIFDPAAPDTRWAYSGSVDPARKRESALILQPNSGPKVGRFPDRTTQGMLNYYLSRHQTIQLNLKDGVLAGRWEAVNAVLELKRVSAAPQVASPAVAPPRATALAVQGAAPVVTGAAQTEAPVTRTPGQYPALTLPANGKPVAAAHRVSVSGKNVRLALQILAPGKTVGAVRIDNVGGVSAAWRSDGKDGAAPLRVEDGTASLTEGKTAMSLALGEAEKLLTLTLTDNGAVAGKKTDFRVTVFFMDKSRVMCLLPG